MMRLAAEPTGRCQSLGAFLVRRLLLINDPSTFRNPSSCAVEESRIKNEVFHHHNIMRHHRSDPTYLLHATSQ
jgi:hypothetical protein